MFHDVELEGVGELSDASDRMGDSGQALGRFEADRGAGVLLSTYWKRHLGLKLVSDC